MKKIAELIESIGFYSLVAEADKVFGPYEIGDVGRKIIIVIDSDGKRSTVSYPKWIMEQHLGRKLDSNLETIDHINTDKNDNRIENLRIMPRDQHSAEDAIRVRPITITCVQCGKVFERSPRLVKNKSNHGKVSSFCSKECAGRYGRQVQLGKIDKLPVPPPPVAEYYKRKYETEVAAMASYLLEKYGSLVA